MVVNLERPISTSSRLLISFKKNGQERTAAERKNEIADIDIDHNGRIAFIEYLLLHYKAMILNDYYTRTGQPPKYDLSTGGKGIGGVGYELLDELFTIPSSLPPELVRALEELTAQKKAREAEMASLAATAKGGGVKGGVAAQKLAAMQVEGLSDEMKKTEAKINSAIRKTGKNSAQQELDKKKQAEDKAAKEKASASKAALKAKAAQWEQAK